jgi:chloride channel protein, CIC family
MQQPDERPPPRLTRPRRWLAFPLLEAITKNETARLMGVGALIGMLGGMAAAAFDLLATRFGRLVLGTAEPSVGELPVLVLLLGPVIGGLLAGLILQHLSRTRRPTGIPDVIDAAANHQGTMPLRESLYSALAAIFAIGSGHSGGREGPIVALSAALSAKACRLFRVPRSRARVLVAAGAAGGIAASFNTPLGACFFALEIILGNFAMDCVAPVVAASVAGTMVGQAIMGNRVALELPAFALQHPVELLIYPLLGVLCGGVALGFQRVLLRAHDLRDRIRTRVPAALIPALGGLVIGVIAAVGVPQVMGNGYAFMEQILHGDHPGVLFLIVLLAVKLLATAVTLGSRTGPGTFAPTLFLGAVTGTLFGIAVNALWPGVTESAGAYGMVGMGAVVAAATHSPITTTLMLFEMTGNYAIVPPLLITVALSGILYAFVEDRSIFVSILERRGVRVDRGREELVMYDLRVADVMRKDGIEIVHPEAPFSELATHILHRRVKDVYVVDHDGKYHGLVDIQDIKRLLTEPHEELTATDVETHDAPVLRTEMPLADAVPLFFRSDLDELPVLNTQGELIAVLQERDIFGAYHREVLRKDALMARIQTSPADQNRWKNFLELPEGYIMDVVEVDGQLVGHSLRDLRLPVRFDVTVVAISVLDPDSGKHRRLPASAELTLKKGDKLVVMGPVIKVLALQAAHVDHEDTEMVSRHHVLEED